MKKYNLADSGPLRDLLVAPFGEAGDAIWKNITNGEQDRVTRSKRKDDDVHESTIETSPKAKKPRNQRKIDDKSAEETASVEGKVQPGKCGLLNITNSCYMSAALQCLSHIEPLKEAFVRNFQSLELNW